MAGYVCPECKRRSKLPDFCCGSSMVTSGTYFCPSCKSKSSNSNTCDCGTTMLQL